MKFVNLFLVICSLFLVVGTGVQAQNFVITGNSDGSDNSVLFDAASNTNIHQSNTVDVTNTINANANTGGNSVNDGNGGSIVTGNATVNVNVTNNLNNNSANIVCCGTPTPKPTKTPASTPTSTPMPTPTPSNNGGGDGGHNDPGGSGGGSSSGQVLGLSGTSGAPVAEYLIYASAFICLIVAKKILITAS